MDLIQAGDRCLGPGMFTKQCWYDHHIKGLFANPTILLTLGAKISETVCSDLVYTLGSTTLGLSTFGSFTNTQSYFYNAVNYEEHLTSHMTHPLELTWQEQHATHPDDLAEEDDASYDDWDEDWEDDWE